MGDIAGWMTKNREGVIGQLRKVPGVDVDKIDDVLNKFVNFANASGRSLDNIAAAAAKADAGKGIKKIGAELKYNIPNLKDFTVKDLLALPKNLLPDLGKKLVSIGFFSPTKLKRMNLMLMKRFSNSIAKDPDKLAVLVRTAGDQASKLTDDILKQIEKIPGYEQLPGMGKKSKGFGFTPTITNMNDLLFSLNNRYKSMYDSIVDSTIKNAVENQSLMWTMYQGDALNRLGSLASAGKLGQEGLTWWNEFMSNLTSARKWANEIGNEAVELLEQFGVIANQGNEDAIIVPLIKKAIIDVGKGTAAEALDTEKPGEALKVQQYNWEK